MIPSDVLERMLVEVALGKPLTHPDTAEMADVRKQLTQECAVIRAKGGEIDIPAELPDLEPTTLADAFDLASRDENVLHRAADVQVPKIMVAVRYAFALGRKALRKNIKDATGAAAAVKTALEDVLPATLQHAMKAGGEAGLARLPQSRAAEELKTAKGPLLMKFDANNSRAKKWADEHAAELAKDISATTEERIREAVGRAVDEGDLEGAYDDILLAVGDEDRAQLIARTEAMTAVNEGQREAWDQAVDEGLLTGDEKKIWIATSDACPECDALDGETTDIDGEYSGDAGDGPPLHPNCRCTEGIVG